MTEIDSFCLVSTDIICMEQKPKDMDELIKLLQEVGHEVKRGKYVSLKERDQKKFLRMRSLGTGYREQDLEEVFAGESAFTPDTKLQRKENLTVKPESKVDMFLYPGYHSQRKRTRL